MSPVNINDDLHLSLIYLFHNVANGAIFGFFIMVWVGTITDIISNHNFPELSFSFSQCFFYLTNNFKSQNVKFTVKRDFWRIFFLYKPSKYLITFFFLTVHWWCFQQHTYNNRQYNLPSNNPLFWHFVTVAAIHGPIKLLEAFQIFSV